MFAVITPSPPDHHRPAVMAGLTRPSVAIGRTAGHRAHPFQQRSNLTCDSRFVPNLARHFTAKRAAAMDVNTAEASL
ncbi:MAG TPA: hypothetical protein VKQ27_19320, partial [Acetobacteraceae bacterium]|nr:hypothetical protein [Acetobacteraceae bacterium]